MPSGVEEDVMFAVAPDVDTVRGRGRSADRWSGEGASAVGLEGAGGEEGAGEGEGLSKTVSESTSMSGVDGFESAMANA